MSIAETRYNSPPRIHTLTYKCIISFVQNQSLVSLIVLFHPALVHMCPLSLSRRTFVCSQTAAESRSQPHCNRQGGAHSTHSTADCMLWCLMWLFCCCGVCMLAGQHPSSCLCEDRTLGLCRAPDSLWGRAQRAGQGESSGGTQLLIQM